MNHLRGEKEIKGDKLTWRVIYRTQECMYVERLWRDYSGERVAVWDVLRLTLLGNVHAIVTVARAGLSGYARLCEKDRGEVAGEEEAFAMVDDCTPARIAQMCCDAVQASWPKEKEGDPPQGEGKGQPPEPTNGG